MQSLKSTGGLSHDPHNAYCYYCLITSRMLRGLSFTTSEHHTDAIDSRILRDNEDVPKLVDWFESHDPFPTRDFVMSIRIGNLGAKTINCHRAFECGNTILHN
ncbi:hypothetical protein AVEN_192737-1 [Araneus ventricosus]|uniref:Uncharacterized protein n=1 Tax=Araneus ventricosus TaxID=182803 RepID=A0A4Y2KPX6_ARAVE|nr:hypothetical protein AVEN_192737-1 [Araneus ventricosus]